MRKLILVLWCLIIPSSISAQSGNFAEKLIEIKQKYGVVSIVVQRDSPVVFEEVQLFTDRHASFPKLRYVVRNRSPKSIVSVSIEFHQRSRLRSWGRYSDSWIDTTRDTDPIKVLMPPGGIYENMEKVDVSQLMDTKDAQRILDNLRNGPKMLTFWVGFVKKVVFDDGTEYSAAELGDNIDDILLYSDS